MLEIGPLHFLSRRSALDNLALFFQVGTISANGEREIGDLIAKAMEKVGKEGGEDPRK